MMIIRTADFYEGCAVQQKPVRIKPRSVGVASLRLGAFYNVASVELGNTTTKCIIVSTNLETSEIYEIGKEVRLTREVSPPQPDEAVFGRTLFGIELTRRSVAEMVSDVLLSVVNKTRLDLHRDIHFVVRSTGVNAGFASPEEVGEIVKALAEGCLQAGVPPRKMTASLSPENLPPGIRDFSWLRKVYFDGAIASVMPPADTSVVANEMEGELVTAGIKGAVKGTGLDVRNPLMTIDFGTTLAGRITDDGYPYAKTVGSFAGLAGAIPDALARGSGLLDGPFGCFLDIPLSRAKETPVSPEWLEKVSSILRVQTVPSGDSRFGTVPVNAAAAKDSGVVLLGVDAGINGSGLPDLEALGREMHGAGGLDLVVTTTDLIQAEIVQRLLLLAAHHNLIQEKTSLGLTGRAITTGKKPELVAARLQLPNGEPWVEHHQLVFVEDGLAMGAAVAARCMNSMGTPGSPMGGRKGDKCIMAERMKIQKS
jgi:putative methanogenesis marker protein 14